MMKLRRFGKGMCILSALLLMFVAVGCDDSDSTEPDNYGEAAPINGGTVTAIQPISLVNGVVQNPVQLTTVGGVEEGLVFTDATVTIPAGTIMTINGQLYTGNDISLVVKAGDWDSVDLYPGGTFAVADGEMQTAGFIQVYFVNSDGDFLDLDFETPVGVNPISATIIFSDNAVVPGTTDFIAPGVTLYAYSRDEAETTWTALDNDLVTPGDQNAYTVDNNLSITILSTHLTYFSFQTKVAKKPFQLVGSFNQDDCAMTIKLAKTDAASTVSVTSFQYKVRNTHDGQAFGPWSDVMPGDSFTFTTDYGTTYGYEFMVKANFSNNESKVYKGIINMQCLTGGA